MEVVNKILIMRPRHPVAELIKYENDSYNEFLSGDTDDLFYYLQETHRMPISLYDLFELYEKTKGSYYAWVLFIIKERSNEQSRHRNQGRTNKGQGRTR